MIGLQYPYPDACAVKLSKRLIDQFDPVTDEDAQFAVLCHRLQDLNRDSGFTERARRRQDAILVSSPH
jgi:hypothetical protein